MLDILAQQWLEAKAAESRANSMRKNIEDQLSSLIGVAENMVGTEHATPPGYKITITGRMTSAVDGDKLQLIAQDAGIVDELSRLFRWKPEIDKKKWDAAPENIRQILGQAVTTKPARLAYKIEKVEA
jgi:hypothetical protein